MRPHLIFVARALTKHLYKFRLFAASLIGFIAFVSLGTFLMRPVLPDAAELPALPFFIAYSFFPCLFSLFLVNFVSTKHLAIRFLVLLIAVAFFWFLWVLQLRVVIHFALTLQDIQAAAACSNFVTFTGLLLDSAATIATVFLVTLTLAWRWVSQSVRTN